MIGYTAFGDEPAPWLREGDRYRLRRWPALAELNITLDQVRMTAMLGNAFATADELAAAAHTPPTDARRLVSEGADIIDIGAESTRPYLGAQPVEAEQELERLRPILRDVVALGVPVSIDSMKSNVVAAAFDAGAVIANDVWGLQRDTGMAKLLAARNSPVIVMHNRERADAAIDIMKDISAFFSRSLDIAAQAGIPTGNIVLDPGIGFGKTPGQSMTVLARLDEFKSFGLPILVGASRKRFIASVAPSEPKQRLGGSIAAHLIAARGGARIIRTHDVAETVQALRVAAAIEEKR